MKIASLVLSTMTLASLSFAGDSFNCKSGANTLKVKLSESLLTYSINNKEEVELKLTKERASRLVYSASGSKLVLTMSGSKISKAKLRSNSGKYVFSSCALSDSAEVTNTDASIQAELAIDANLAEATDGNAGKFKVFSEIGKFSKLNFKPQSSPLSFNYDVFYYIPSKLSNKTNLNTLVFMHGGGASTSTRSGSASVVGMYNRDLMALADELGFILVMPSGSGINWGSHLLSYFKDLNAVMRKDLPINPNKIGLAGHSMGAMGITRSAHWLVDEYAFFMPLAGGIQDNYNIDGYLSTYFNTNYHHIQGRNDHFGVFITRCEKQEENVKRLEALYGKKSGFKLEFYAGGHNYNRSLVKKGLKNLYANAKRDLYQKELYPIFYYRKETLTDRWSNGNTYYLAPRNRYFWLKATDFHQKKKVAKATAKIANNQVDIKIDTGVVKTLRVYLSAKMLDLSKEVQVVVNGKTVSSSIVAPKVDTEELNKDSSFIFESYIDVTIN